MHAAGIIPSMNSTIKHSKPYVYNLLIWKNSIFLCINAFDNRREISMYIDYIRIYFFKIWNCSNYTFSQLYQELFNPEIIITEKLKETGD